MASWLWVNFMWLQMVTANSKKVVSEDGEEEDRLARLLVWDTMSIFDHVGCKKREQVLKI